MRTVENHISHILDKKRLSNRVEIARYVFQQDSGQGIYVAGFERKELNSSIGTGRITKLLRSLLTSVTV